MRRKIVSPGSVAAALAAEIVWNGALERPLFAPLKVLSTNQIVSPKVMVTVPVLVSEPSLIV